MKILRKIIRWVIQLDDGNVIEMETCGRELLYVKPLKYPIGMVFYLR